MKIVRKFVKAIQMLLITVSLTLVYFVLFGVTYFFMAIFKRADLLGHARCGCSSWVKAEGYSAHMEDALRES